MIVNGKTCPPVCRSNEFPDPRSMRLDSCHCNDRKRFHKPEASSLGLRDVAIAGFNLAPGYALPGAL
jgi:hypothetical protein